MFATLIVQLPTYHEGGQLIVKQKGNLNIFCLIKFKISNLMARTRTGV